MRFVHHRAQSSGADRKFHEHLPERIWVELRCCHASTSGRICSDTARHSLARTDTEWWQIFRGSARKFPDVEIHPK